MFKKKALFILLITSCSFLFSNHQQLILFQEPLLRFYNHDNIILKKGTLQSLINKWQKRLDNTWNAICKKIEKETNFTPEKIQTFLHDKNLLHLYTKINERALQNKNSTFIPEENIDPAVLSFIKQTLHKYCSKRNIKIVLSPFLPTISATFGSDEGTHYVICNSEVYSPENIDHFYSSLTENHGVFVFKPSAMSQKPNIIELSNLLLIGLIESASHIEHQSNLLMFTLSNFKLTNNKISLPLIKNIAKFLDLRGELECILQSKNPLETAVFIAQTKNMNYKERTTWHKIIQEILECYHPTSLIKFKQLLHLLQQDNS